MTKDGTPVEVLAYRAEVTREEILVAERVGVDLG